MPAAIDLTSLRLLRTIADTGTITAAAARLGSTQPAVSQHVRRLEQRLGTPVLERHPRGVRLTEAGAVLARYGGSVAAALDAAQREVESLTGLRAGRVRVVSFPSASATLVPSALAALRTTAPNLEVQLTDDAPAGALRQLRDGRCDIALVDDRRRRPRDGGRSEPWADEVSGGLHRRRLVDDPSVLAITAQDERGGARKLHLRDLADDVWAVGCPMCADHLRTAAGRAGFEPVIRYRTDHVATLGLVAAGLALALLPGLASADAARHPGVMVRSLSGVKPRSVCALTTADLARVPAVASVLDALQEAASVQ